MTSFSCVFACHQQHSEHAQITKTHQKITKRKIFNVSNNYRCSWVPSVDPLRRRLVLTPRYLALESRKLSEHFGGVRRWKTGALRDTQPPALILLKGKVARLRPLTRVK